MFSVSLVQLGTTRNYTAVDEKFLGFVLVYELACAKLHESGSFVKRIDPFCAINRHDCVLQLGCHSVCPHCKHLDTFEFLCVVQVKRNIVLNNRKVKSGGINLRCGYMAGNVSVKSKLQHAPPPRAYPGHLTLLQSRGGGNLIIRVFQGVGNLIPML